MEEPLNLLTLDGGGIRGVSMLLILDEMMKRIQHDKGLASLPRPCEYFHLIGGTSTGGLIALMLGRLQMTTKDALRTYNSIAGSIFCKANRKSSFKDGAFKATTLEKQIQDLVAIKKLGEHIFHENDEAGSSKTFVCAVPAVNMAHPRLFRSYAVRENAGSNCKIWEAARATTAAPTFFKRITIMDDGGAQEEFLDGGLLFNNPAQLALSEASTIFGDASKLGCLISIGTGYPGTIGLSQPDAFQKILPTAMIGVLKQITTNCEKTAHELAKRFRQLPNCYFRFSVVPKSATKPITKSSMKSQPLSSNLFTGREDFINTLGDYFTDQGPGQHLRREYLLYGMGGAGKTQIALKFSEKHRSRLVYESVVWVDATNRDTLEQSYKTVASKIGTDTDSNCSLEVVLRKLESYEGSWLLLLDGADNLDDISELWPPGIHGDILITSRNRMLRRLSGSQKRCVSEMNENEASELLLKSAHLDMSLKNYEKQASDIVAELGYLALAIDQAGAYIANCERCIDDFLETFNIHRQRLLQNEAYKGASGNDRAVYATWDLSYNAIARQAESAANETSRQGPKAALQILQVFPFLHNEGIMEDIFRFAAENAETEPDTVDEVVDEFPLALLSLRPDGSWDSQNFRLGIQTLISFSLIGRDDSQQHFFMHRLVHLWAFDRLAATEKECSYSKARDLLEKSITWEFQTSDYAFRRDLLPHITALQRQTASITEQTKSQELAGFALVFDEAGRWKEAEELRVEVMETRKRVLGEEHSDTLDSIANLASTYWNQGRWKEAEELEVEVVKIRERVLGEEHPDTLDSIANLAATYSNQKRWKEAEELEVGVVEKRKGVLGEEHPDTLRSISNLALTYRNQGRWKEAEEIRVGVVETSKRALGEEHPETLVSKANLAATYWDQGRWKEAEELDVGVIEIRKRVLGEQHPSTLTSKSNLAAVYLHQGRCDEAEELGVGVLDIMRRVLGEEHPDTLISMHNLAFTFKSQSRDEEAISLLKKCVELRKQILGPTHPDTEKSLEALKEWENEEQEMSDESSD
ncbi:MAG: hypothetical protein Q9225_004121 [Loekoesia sp. 1 TL-2023]